MNFRMEQVDNQCGQDWRPFSRVATRCAIYLGLGLTLCLAQLNVVRAQTPDKATPATSTADENANNQLATATTSPAKQRAANRTNLNTAAGELEGEAELRWILQRLELTGTQQKDVDSLLETYRYRTGEGADVTHLNELLLDYQAAEEVGDQQRLAEIKAELTNARPDVKARREFLSALREMLQPSQQRQLTAIESFLRDFPSGVVTPLHIFKLAKALGLSPKQVRELDQVHAEFRTRRIPQLGAPKRIPLSGVEAEFAQAIRSVLTTEQRVAFDRELEATQLRVEREAAMGKGGAP